MSFKKQLVTDETQRIPIKFESADASNVFYSKLWPKNGLPDDRYVGVKKFTIPFIVMIDHTIIYETAYYNSVVRRADTNGDGIITLKEAIGLQ